MIYAEIWVTEDEGAAAAIREDKLLTEAQHASFTRLAHGNGTKSGAIKQAEDYIRSGEYKAVRVFQGKRLGKLIYQGYASLTRNGTVTKSVL